MLKATGLLLSLFILVILAHGYWHRSTYGMLNVSYHGIYVDPPLTPESPPLLVLKDRDNQFLAQGKCEIVNHDCRRIIWQVPDYAESGCAEFIENSPYDNKPECFDKYSRWARKIGGAAVYFDLTWLHCKAQKQPLNLEPVSEGGFLWWLQALFPHGDDRKPTLDHVVGIYANPRTCNVYARY